MTAAPHAFTLYRPQPDAIQDACFDETLLELAAQNGPTACIWETGRGLVVPRTYRRFDAFETVCRHFAENGWPVTVRQTGGGIVPQGPGIVNLSLAYRVNGMPLRHSEPGYERICALLAAALASLGIEAFPAAVEGSFCDGRYNLAVRLHGAAVKVAGTAQMWRRLAGEEDAHIGLVHALVLVDTDTAALTAIANAFEAALGSERRYLAERVVSATELLAAGHGVQRSFEQALERALTAAGGC